MQTRYLVSSRDEPIAQSLKEHKVTTAQLRPVAEWREAERNVQCDGAVLFNVQTAGLGRGLSELSDTLVTWLRKQTLPKLLSKEIRQRQTGELSGCIT